MRPQSQQRDDDVSTRSLTRRRWLASVIAASLVALGGIAMPTAAEAVVGPPWTNPDGGVCEGQAFVGIETSGPHGIRTIDVATGAIVDTVSMDHGFNSLGFSPNDGYLYGTFRPGTEDSGLPNPGGIASTGTIWRIGSDGTYEIVPISGPNLRPPAAINANAGALPDGNWPEGTFDQNGHYWVADKRTNTPRGTTTIFELQLNGDGSMSQVSGVQLVQPYPDVSDISDIPGTGKLWAITDSGAPSANLESHLVAIDKVSGAVTDYGPMAGLPVGQFIGMFVDARGDLYAVQSGSGTVWAINRGQAVNPDGTVTGTPLIARSISSVGSLGNGDAAQCGLVAVPALRFSKVVDKAVAPVGDTLTYTIHVENLSFFGLTDIPVTDALPPLTTYVSSDSGGAEAGGVVNWTIPTLAPGASTDLHVSVTIDSVPGVPLVNSVLVENPPDVPPGTPPPTPTPTTVCADDPSRACATTDVPPPALEFGKTVEETQILAGDQVHYTVTVTNTGLSGVADVPVTDTLPAGVDFVSADSGGVEAGGVITWTIASLAAGASVELHVVGEASADILPGTYVNRVLVENPPDVPGMPPPVVIAPCADDATQSCAAVVVPPPALEFGKTVEETQVVAGDQGHYTVTVTNTGLSDVADVPVTDTLPAGVDFVSADNGGTEAGGVITWTIASIPAGESVELLVVGEASADILPGTYVNRVLVENPPDIPGMPPPVVIAPCTDDATQSCAAVVVPPPGLEFGKTVEETQVVAGDQIHYTVTVTNTGLSDVADVPVTDTLPIGVDFVSADNGGIEAGGVITWTIASIPAGESVELLIVGEASADILPGTYVNRVLVENPPDIPGMPPPVVIDPCTDDPAQSCADVVVPPPALEFGKTVEETEVVAGDQIHYTVTVTNTGLSDVADVPVTDTLPAGVDFVSADNGGTEAGGVITWTIASIPAGESVELLIVGEASADILPGTYVNRVLVENPPDIPGMPPPVVVDPCADDATQSCADVVVPPPALEFGKTVEETQVVAGDQIHYTVTVTNTGDSDVADVPVTDTLPVGVDFVSADSGGVEAGGVITWTIASIPAGESVELLVVAQASAGITPGTYVNRVLVENPPDVPGMPPPVVIDPCADDPAQSCAEVEVPPLALEFGKTVEETQVVAGDQIHYTVTVTNTGGAAVTGVPVTDTLPAGVDFVSADNGGTEAGGVITWTIASIATGESVELLVIGEASADILPGTYVNRVLVENPPDMPGMPPPVVIAPCADDPAQSCADVVVPPPALEFGKTVEEAQIVAGGQVHYTVTVTNTGLSGVADVPVTDTLPAGVDFISADNGGTEAGGVITWTIASIPAGESVELLIVGEASADILPGTYVNRVLVENPPDVPGMPPPVVIDPCVDDATQSCADVVVPPPALEFGKTVEETQIVAGGQVHYTVTVTNTGLSDVADVPVTDTLPAGVDFVSADNGGTETGGVITWTIASIPAGESVELLVVGEASADILPGTYVNHVLVENPPDIPGMPPPVVIDPCTDDPAQSCADVVVPPPALEFGKTVEETEVVAGGQVHYTVTVTNIGGAAVAGVPVTDTLPVGVDFVSADNGGAEADGVITWTIASIPAGESVILHVVGQAAAGVTAGTYVNRVLVENPPDVPDMPPPVVIDPCVGVADLADAAAMNILQASLFADDPTQSCAEVIVPPPNPPPPTPDHLSGTGPANTGGLLTSAVILLLLGGATAWRAGVRSARRVGRG